MVPCFRLCLRLRQAPPCLCSCSHSPCSWCSHLSGSDASDSHVGAVLQKCLRGSWSPLAFFFKKLSSAESKYSAFDRELLAAYSSVCHFRFLLEARDFTLFTNHKPLTLALFHSSPPWSPDNSAIYPISMSSPVILSMSLAPRTWLLMPPLTLPDLFPPHSRTFLFSPLSLLISPPPVFILPLSLPFSPPALPSSR